MQKKKTSTKGLISPLPESSRSYVITGPTFSHLLTFLIPLSPFNTIPPIPTFQQFHFLFKSFIEAFPQTLQLRRRWQKTVPSRSTAVAPSPMPRRIHSLSKSAWPRCSAAVLLWKSPPSTKLRSPNLPAPVASSYPNPIINQVFRACPTHYLSKKLKGPLRYP